MVEQLQRLAGMIGEGNAALAQENTEENRKAGKGVAVEEPGTRYEPPDAKKHASQASRTLAEAKKEPLAIQLQWWRDLAWAAKNRGDSIADYILTHQDANKQNIALAPKKIEEIENTLRRRSTINETARAKEKATREAAKREAERARKSGGETRSTRKTAKEVVDILEEWDPTNGTDLEHRIWDSDGFDSSFYQGIRRLVEAHNNSIPIGAIVNLAQSATDSAVLRAVAGLVKKLGLNTKVVVLPALENKPGMPSQTGRYDPQTDTIYLRAPNGDLIGGMTPGIFLHEALHAAVSHRLARAAQQYLDNVPITSMTPEELKARDAVVELLKVFEGVKEAARAEGIQAYGFANIDEFISEAFTNQSFQNWLRGVEYTGDKKAKTMWGKIKEVFGDLLQDLRRALGFNTDKVENALDAVISFTPDLFRTRGFSESEMDLSNSARMKLGAMGLFNADPDLVGFDLGHGPALNAVSAGMADLGKQFEKATGEAGRGAWVGMKEATRKALLYAMSFKNIVSSFERYFPALRAIGEAQNKQRAAAQSRNIEAAKVVNRVQNFVSRNGGWDPTKADNNSKPALLFRLMEQTTLQGIDPRKEMKEQSGFKDTEEFRNQYGKVASMWERVGGEGRALWTQMAEYNRKHFEEVYGQLSENIVRLFGDKAVPEGMSQKDMLAATRKGEFGKEAKLNQAALDERFNKVKTPYFHLSRFGDYFIRYQNEEGESAEHSFEMFESRAQFDARLNELKKQGLADPKKYPSWQAGKMSERIESLDQGSWKFVRAMIERIDDTGLDAHQRDIMKDTIRQLYLQMLPETSSQKMFAQRKGTPGWDRDMMRNFAKRAEVGNYQLAHAEAAVPMSDAIGKLKEQLTSMEKSGDGDKTSLAIFGRDIEKEIRQRQAELMKQPSTPVVDKLTSLNYAFYLGLSPAFLLVNLLQPYQMTLPVVGGKFGHAKSAVEMAKNAGRSFKMLKSMVKDNIVYPDLDIDAQVKAGTITADQGEFLKDALASGRIDITLAHEIGEVRKHGATSPFNKTMHVLGLVSHYSEVQNRLTAGLTAFDMARKGDMDQQAATDYANRVIDATQFDYTSQNQARLMGKYGFAGKITPIFTAFQRYNMQSLELLARLTMESFGGLNATTQEAKEARRALLGLFTSTGVLAGALGLPAVGLITAMIDKLFGGDDEPLDSKAAFRNFLADIFGKETAEVVARGGPRAIGMDLSQRTGFDNVVPFTRMLADKRKLKDMMEAQAVDALGPVVGGGLNILYGAQQIADGQVIKGLEKALPFAPLRNVAKATELANGSVTDAKGRKIPLEVNGWDVMNQMMGLTPRPLAERAEALYAVNARTREIQEYTQKLREHMFRAMENKDFDAIAKARSDIIAFNQKHPEFAITGIGRAFAQQQRAQEIGRQQGIGVGVGNAKNLPRLDIGRFANL